MKLLITASCFAFLVLIRAAFANPERVFATVSPSVVVVEGGGRQGSGVIVAPQLVATNCHVTGDAPSLVVRRGPISHAALVAASDRDRDLCLLDVPTLQDRPVSLGRAARLRVGVPVYAIGAPAGLELSLSSGLVSSLRDSAAAPLIQTTAPISPGSSGGGLFDERGQLVGITTFTVRAGQNVNFALPVEWVAVAITSRDAIRTARRRCHAAPEPTCLFNWALVLARSATEDNHRSVAFAAIARAQAEAGDFTGAISTARNISDAASLALALIDIIDVQAAAGDIVGARASALRLSDPFERSAGLAGLAKAQARTGDIAGALANTEAMTESFIRNTSLTEIAERQAAAGDIDGARATTRKISGPRLDRNPSERFGHSTSAANFAIIRAQIKAKNFQAAINMAHESGIYRIVLQMIAEEQAQSGDIAGVFNTILLDQPEFRRVGYITITRLLQRPRSEELRAVLIAAREITDAEARARALATLLRFQLQNGDRQGAAQSLNDAYTAARLIADADIRSEALEEIRRNQVAGGDFAGAIAAAREINDSSLQSANSRSATFAQISTAQAESGNIAGALTTAREITRTPSLLASTFTRVASFQRQGGDLAGASSSLDRALVAANEATPEGMRSSYLQDIIREQMHMGNIDRALATARMNIESNRAFALRGMVRTLTEVGDFARALNIAREIDVAYLDSSLLENIARGQTQAGDVPGALATAQSIADATRRGSALAGIAREQAKSGDLPAAIATVDGVEPYTQRAAAIANVASAFASRR